MNKKIEGLRYGIPYSNKKVKWKAVILYWKSRKKELRNKSINKETMMKRKLEAEIDNKTTIIEEAEEK